ncbi:MAG: carbamoyltransferase N-terminal domain-containing protein, partial [Pseudomonadota bacterium]
MKVLGLVSKTHDTGLALLEDGKPLVILEEERFNREKHTKSFPINSLKAAFIDGPHDFDDVDVIATPWRQKALVKTFFNIVTSRMPASLNLLRPAAHSTQDSGIVNLWLRLQIQLRAYLKRRKLPPIVEVGHHESHASVFFVSPFEEATIVVMDGYGDECSTSVFHGKGNKIEPVKKLGFFDSLGMLYTCATNHLGFKTFEEGTVMALAACGKPTYVEEFRKVITLNDDGTFTLNRDYVSIDTHGLIKPFTPKFTETFGKPRQRHEPLEDHHRDLAYAVQAVTEEAVLNLVRSLEKDSPSRNLVITGGVALNCVANARVLRDTGFERVWVPPCASDTGAPLGAALYHTHHTLGMPRVMEMTHPFYGQSYSDDDIEAALSDANLAFEKLDDDTLFNRVAKDLSERNIVGWFQGPYEIGPRALGNRSILADPRSLQIKHIINARIKYREPFRPFAPAVLLEHADEYFEIDQPDPFMTGDLQVLIGYPARAVQF